VCASSSREHGVEVELGKAHAALQRPAPGQELEARQQRLRLAPAVRLDVAHHDVLAARLPLVRLDQHRVGLAHARRRPEEDLEPRAPSLLLRAPDTREQGLGVAPRFDWAHGAASIPRRAAALTRSERPRPRS
jgi:hypothetical protein